MSLKKLVVVGFKSFAKRTTITFSKGINAIVGPNGCGKSNIVDAFVWALGEQSAKTLRGAKMHDVIFAGSQLQKAVHFAEVCITFENQNHYLPIGYDEIEVTRRLHRDDSSEYILNKQQVRLKDIQELFAHTGLAHDTFAVIGQDRVGKIISQSPQERRSMFEGVAGILHFLIKRKESLQKLIATESSMERAQDIAKEVAIQKATLEKQAEEAKKFQNDRDRLAYVEEQLAKKLLTEVEARYARIIEELALLSQKKEAEFQKEQNSRHTLSEKKELLKKNRLEVGAKSDFVHTLTNTQNLCRNEIANAQQQKKIHQQKLANLQNELQATSDLLAHCAQKKESAACDKEQYRLQLDKSEREYKAIEQKFSEVHRKHESDLAALKKLGEEKAKLEEQVQFVELELKKGQLSVDVATEKVKARSEVLDALIQKMDALVLEIEAKRSERAKLVEKVQQKKGEIGAISQKLQELEKEDKALIKMQEETKKELFEKEAQLKVLGRAISDMEGFSQGAKTISLEAKKPASPLFEKVTPLVDYLDDEESSAHIARLYAATLVVKTESDLALCLELMLAKKQEVSFLCLDFLGIQDPKSYLKKAIASVESLDEAKKIKRSAFIASDFFIDSLGVIFSLQNKEQNPFQRKRKVKELEGELKLVQEKLLGIEKQRAELDSKKKKLAQAQSSLDEEMRLVDYSVVSTTFQLQEFEKQKIQVQKEHDVQKQERLHFETVVKSLQEKAEGLDKKLKEAREQLQQKEASRGKQEAVVAAYKNEHASLQEIARLESTRYQEAKSSFQKAEYGAKLTAVEENEAKKRLDLFVSEQNRSQEMLKECHEKGIQAQKTLEQSVGESDETRALLEKMDAELVVLEKEVADLEAELVATQAVREKLSNALAGYEVERSHLSSECNRFRDQLPQKEVKLELDMTASQMQEQVKRLKNALDRNRQVNLMAIDELETVLGRLHLIQEQLADLTEAKLELCKIIEELEKESRKAFTETFEAIRAAFKRHFQTLFNGGDADLVLTRGEDALDAGIEIWAKPPGKEMRSMQLMSGGEKSLTALALLFGCFEVRPSPFCILDEVDAALDEANVERFGMLLKSFSGKLQFLVITHNKRTMACADTLIGVSMQEKGVSQIISLDFNRLEEQQEHAGMGATLS